MIYRCSVKCDNCDSIYTCRIAIGHSSYQEHTFQCEKCDEELTISLQLNQTEGTGEPSFKNCTKSETEGKVYNFHPEFELSADYRHTDIISSNIIALSHLMQNKKKNLDILRNLNNEELSQVRKQANGLFLVNEEWSIVSKIWKFYIRNKNDLLKDYIVKNKSKIFEYKPEITAPEIIFSFLFRCLAPALEDHLRDIIKIVAKKYRKNPSVFTNFCKYHANYIFKENQIKIQEIVRNFFLAFPEFSQNFLSIKKGEPITSEPAYSSVNFNKIKSFYGDAYECLGSGIVTLACLNNLLKGRKYDTFATMNLEKYLSLKKSSKNNCFNDIPEFNCLFTHYDAQIRNGSHHGNIRFDPATNTVFYDPNGNGKEKSLLYFEYLNKCCYLFFSCCVIGTLDIFIYDKLRFAVMRDSAGLICKI